MNFTACASHWCEPSPPIKALKLRWPIPTFLYAHGPPLGCLPSSWLSLTRVTVRRAESLPAGKLRLEN